jgi:hypothetical protein
MQQPEYIPYQNRKPRLTTIFLGACALMALAGFILFQIPRFHRAITWRLDVAVTYARRLIRPVSSMPTPSVQRQPNVVVVTPTATAAEGEAQEPAAPAITATPTMVPTPIPMQAQLPPPAYDEARDKQDWNNCGPATLALQLRFWGWQGDQFDISDVIKPTRDDRNVNVEELVYFVRTRAGWLNAEYRVGGDLDTIKELIAAGIPVITEETFTVDRQYWPNDDLWSGHYRLITGYDDATQLFTAHDTEIGANQKVTYAETLESWQSFNYVYIIVYPPEMEETVKGVLGEDWDVDTNRQNALRIAERETQEDPDNAFAWFNLGNNLAYFARWYEAADAFDVARTIGLPQRMFRYQFTPFMAYFHSMRTDDLMALTKYALDITRTSEEAMLWRGYGFYRLGDNSAALSHFRSALRIRPGYYDALTAIDLVTGN